MGKSKHRKGHAEKLERYKKNKKIEQEVFKKKMIENYMKLQQESLENREAHTSTEEVVGPEINIDELNEIEDWESIDIESDINVEDANVEIVNVESEISEILETNDNNNQ